MMGNFSSITSAISSTVSSPWVASSSNIYFNAGSVGIGSSAPTRALDVSGNVAVSGTVTAGNTGFKVYTVTGTLPGTSGSNSFSFPAGVSWANIIAISGVANYNGAAFVMFPSNMNTRDPTANWDFWLYYPSTLYVYVYPSGTNVAGQAFKVTFITSL